MATTTDHGVNIEEQPTGVLPPVSISAGLPVYVGTAPINDGDLTSVGVPVLCETLADFEASFGPLTHDFQDWTLHEAAAAHFSAYQVGPIVCINVIDPTNSGHVETATNEETPLVAGEATLQVYGGPAGGLLGILESTVVVKNAGESITYTLGADYTLAFDSNGNLVLTVVATGRITDSQILYVTFNYLNASGVVANDVIGGYNVVTGKYTGIMAIDLVYPTLRLVAGFLLAPGWTHVPTVAAALAAKAPAVSGLFRAHALTDLSANPANIATYAAAPAWKTSNGYTAVDQTALWPKSQNGTDVYHLSTVLACVANLTDNANGDIPFASPSNKAVVGSAAVLDDGTQVLLTRAQANVLNDQGIVTLLNGINGWRLWGNRTACYPADTDPKDSFIAVRRMFNWIGNTIILTTDQNIDTPLNRRLVDLVVSTIGSFINGLIAVGALVDGKIAFLSSDNPITDLENGEITWDVTLTPPSPAQQLNFKLQYDPSALAELFN